MRRTGLTSTLAVALSALAVTACGSSPAHPSAQTPATVDRPTGSVTSTTLPSSPGAGRTTTTRPPDRTTTTATSPTSVTTVTTTTAPATTPTVPATITAAYVDSVFAVLNHIYGNATRLMISTTNLPPPAVADIRSIFADPEFNTELKIFSLELDQGFAGVKIPPGDRVTRVVRIISESTTCVFAQTATSFAAVVQHPPAENGSEYTGIETKLPSNDPQGLNSTNWAIFFNESFPTPTTPPSDPCNA
jgi:hypothetical protein